MKTIKYRAPFRPNVHRIVISFIISMGVMFFLSVIITGEDRLLEYASIGKPYASMLRHGRHSDKKTVILLGDSNCRGLGKMLQHAIEKHGKSVEVQSWDYVCASMTDYYCIYHRALKYSPDLIIVSINWRGFAEEWIKTTWYFNRELSAFVPIEGQTPSQYNILRQRGINPVQHIQYKLFFLYRLYPMGYKAYVKDKFRTLFKLGKYGRKKDLVNLPKRLVLRRNKWSGKFIEYNTDPASHASQFPMRITESNKTLCAISALSNAASKNGTTVLFFIWPMDIEYHKEMGSLNRAELQKSIELVHEVIEKNNNEYCLDLSMLFEDRHRAFKDSEGHCTLPARRKIAATLAPEILRIMQN